MGYVQYFLSFALSGTVRKLSDHFSSDTSLKLNKRLETNRLCLRLSAQSRDEATRTPDPYVPNVVRYQLRYIPILRVQRYGEFLKYVQENA